MVKNGTLASPAMARASSVLPVPGEPTISTPLGILPPSFWNLPGSFRKSTISADFLLGLIDAGDVGEGDVDLVLAEQARAALAEGHGPAAAGGALHLPQHVDEHHDQQQRRGQLQQQLADEVRLLGRRALDLHVRLGELADQGGVVGLGVVGLERGLVLVLARRSSRPAGPPIRRCSAFTSSRNWSRRISSGCVDGGHVAAEHHQQDEHDHDPEQDIFVKSFKGFRPFSARIGDLNEPTPSNTGWPVNTSRCGRGRKPLVS